MDMYSHDDIMLLVERSREHSGILDEVASGLHSRDPELAGDCAELMRSVAEQASDVVRPYARCLVEAAEHPDERVRDEALRAMAILGVSADDVADESEPRSSDA